QVTQLQPQHAFQEQQFGVIGTNLLALQAQLQGRLDQALLQPAVAQQHVELADDAVARVRPRQALLQQPYRSLELPQLGAGLAEVEQRERVGWLLGVLHLQQSQVALKFAGPQCRVGVAGVADDHVGEDDLTAGLADRAEDLLVDAVAPTDARLVAKEPNVV